MSLGASTVSFLSLGPRVETQGRKLHARTHLLWQVLTLGAYGRTVIVCPRRRTIRIHTRLFWLPRERTIRFDEVERLDYRFGSMGTSWGWTSDGYGAHDSMETFSVSLVLYRGNERVPLFSWIGEGARTTGWTGVLTGDSLIDFEGDQEASSKGFVARLQEVSGIPLRRDPSRLVQALGGPRCTSCDRANPVNQTRCQYCGAGLTAAGG